MAGVDPSQDLDFLRASPEDQHAYLMQMDQDYAHARKPEQDAYRAHVNQTTEFSRQTGAAARAAGESQRATMPVLPEPKPTGPVTRFASGAAAGAAAMLPSLKSLNPLSKEGAERLFTPPSLTMLQAAQGSLAEYKRAREENQPRTSAAVAAVAAPMGIDTEGIRERARNKDLAGIAGEAVPSVAATLLGEKAAKVAGKAIEATPGLVKSPYQMFVKGQPPQAMVPVAEKALVQATQPGVNIPRAPESIPQAGARIQQMRQAGELTRADGSPITEIKSTGDLLDAVMSAKKGVWSAIEQRVGQSGQLQADTSSVADAMEKSISTRTVKQFSRAADAIRERAATYREPMKLSDIESAIQDANNDLRNFYKRSGPTDSPISPETAATQAEVKALRDLLDERVEALNGKGVKDLKQEYGALRDLERATAKQHAIATRTKEAGLWEGLAYLHAAGDLLSGNVMGAGKAGFMLGAGRALKTLRDPNFLIEQSFHGPKAFRAATPFEAAPGVNIRGLLPEGPLVTPRTDTSGPVNMGQPPVEWGTRALRKGLLLPEKTGQALDVTERGPVGGAGPNQKPRPFEMARSTFERPDTAKIIQYTPPTEPGGKAGMPEQRVAPDLDRDAKTELDSLYTLWSELPKPGRFVHDVGYEGGERGASKPEIVAYGIKSPKPAVEAMFPWLRDLDRFMSLSRVKAALEKGKGIDYDRILRAAKEHLAKERAPQMEELEQRAREFGMREPGED